MRSEAFRTKDTYGYHKKEVVSEKKRGGQKWCTGYKKGLRGDAKKTEETLRGNMKSQGGTSPGQKIKNP